MKKTRRVTAVLVNSQQQPLACNGVTASALNKINQPAVHGCFVATYRQVPHSTTPRATNDCVLVTIAKQTKQKQNKKTKEGFLVLFGARYTFVFHFLSNGNEKWRYVPGIPRFWSRGVST